MALIKSIYCNIYAELEKKGKEYEARTQGNLAAFFAIAMFSITAFILLTEFYPPLMRKLTAFLDVGGGKTIAKYKTAIVLLPILASVYGIYGTTAKHSAIIKAYKSLSQEEQIKISKKGYRVVLLSVLSIPLAFVLKLFL